MLSRYLEGQLHLSAAERVDSYVHKRKDEGPGTLLDSPFRRDQFGGENDNGDHTQSREHE